MIKIIIVVIVIVCLLFGVKKRKNIKELFNKLLKDLKKVIVLICKSIKKYCKYKALLCKEFLKKKTNYLEEYSNNKDFKKYTFNDLAPKDSIEKSDQYFNAIDWALENKEILNIALTGPYGSGKSSILKSYEKNHVKYKYLNISLAAFDIEKNNAAHNDDGNINKDANIEKGILQQLFYKVDSRRIPYTRFRKIINSKLHNIVKVLVLILSNIFLGVIIFFPQTLGEMKNLHNKLATYIGNANIRAVIYIVFIFLSIYNSVLLIKRCKSRIKLSSLTFEKAQVEIDKQNSESIFNKYLDEILYFFEATKYNVVVIEDLDRFNNTRIFTKLRELNSLINNYEKIKRKIVFVYAVKDDMFKNDERTKFFDFIIPVIPVINSVNAGEILDKLIYQDKFGDGIPKELVRGVSVYINDMRMLTNIYNEFRLYKGILNDIDLKPDKILALVIYKNLYPNDFAKLQFKDGVLYSCFDQEDESKKNISVMINNQIDSNKTLIEKNKNDCLYSINELKQIFINAISGMNKIIKSINSYSLDTILKDDFNMNNILDLETINYIYENRNSYYNGAYNASILLADLDKKMLPRFNSFKERFENLKYKSKVEEEKIRININKLREKQNLLKSYNLQELIEKYSINEVLNEDIIKEKPIVYLLRHGYIDETYENYLTYFYENTITAKDMDFILGVRNYEGQAFDYKLTKFEGIMHKLNDEEFSQKEILNFGLLKYILENKDKYKKQLGKIIIQLSNEEDKTIKFIDGFIDYIKNQDIEKEFWRDICSTWPNIWRYIDDESGYSTDKKDVYLFNIIKYVSVDTIEKLNIDDNLAYYISNDEHFMGLVSIIQEDKIEEVIERLDIEFNIIETDNVNQKLLNYIWDNSRYAINTKIICDILRIKCKQPINLINEKNFTSIMNCDYKELIDYVNQNIGDYIQDVFMNIDENNNNDKENVVGLISWDEKELSDQLKISIINKENFILSKIEEVPQTFWGEILKLQKVEVSWDNVLKYYASAGKLDSILINYLNSKVVYSNLEKDNYEENELTSSFIEAIINCEDIKTSFNSIVKTINWIYTGYDTFKIPDKHLDILIENNILEFNSSIYSSIRENFYNKHIRFIELNFDTYIKSIDDYEVDADDICHILDMEMCSFEDEIIIINKINKDLEDKDKDILNNTLASKIYKDIINNYSKVSIGQSLYKYLFNDCDLDQKLELLSCQSEFLSDEEITESLNMMGEPYSIIAISRSREKIEYSEKILKLANSLKESSFISSFSEPQKDGKKYIQFNSKER